ncbi:MAG TPA: hypothetical protein VF132_03935 [Rudaea sp.]
MASPKTEVADMLAKLPENSSFEDIQYHLYVLEKMRRGAERAEREGEVPHDVAKQRFATWLER